MPVYETTIEVKNLVLDISVDYEIDPGEPMVWRTPNGDGYPGSPAHPYDTKTTVWSVSGETYDLDREEIDPGWVDVLDRIADDYVEEHLLEDLPLECYE